MHVDHVRLTTMMDHVRLHVPMWGCPWHHVAHDTLGPAHLRLVRHCRVDHVVSGHVMNPLRMGPRVLMVYVLMSTRHLDLTHPSWSHVGGLVRYHPPHSHSAPVHRTVVRGWHAWVDSHWVWLVRHSNCQRARHAPSPSVTWGSHAVLLHLRLGGHMWPSHLHVVMRSGHV